MLILAVLGDRWMNGYTLIQELHQRSGGLLDLPEGTVYPALHRLNNAGHLQRRNQPDGRRCQYYRLTPRGQQHLARRRQHWHTMTDVVDSVLHSVTDHPSAAGPATDDQPAPAAPVTHRLHIA